MQSEFCKQLAQSLEKLRELKGDFDIAAKGLENDGHKIEKEKYDDYKEAKNKFWTKVEEIEEILRVPRESIQLTKEIFSSPEKEEEFFDQLRRYWINFYDDNGLSEMVKKLPKKIEISEEDRQRLLTRIEEGFNFLILIPTNAKEYIKDVIDKMVKPLKGMAEGQQYSERGVWMKEGIREEFPKALVTKQKVTGNRPKYEPYLLLVKDQFDGERWGDDPEDFMTEFHKRGLKGLTLLEYFIFQRDYALGHKDEEWVHLGRKSEGTELILDSEAWIYGKPAEVITAEWNKRAKEIWVSSVGKKHLGCSCTARASNIFEIKT